MKTKIAEFLADYIPSLSKEEIEQLIETPPTQDPAIACMAYAEQVG